MQVKWLGGLWKTTIKNSYLDAYGYYRQFENNKRKSHSSRNVPRLPYSLSDLLTQKKISERRILVLHSGSTARWFCRNHNEVILGRRCLGHRASSRLHYLDDVGHYQGEALDMLIIDWILHPEHWLQIRKHLSASAVVVILLPPDDGELDNDLLHISKNLTDSGMKMLRFRNPAPDAEIMIAELWYPNNNFLGI